MQGLNVRAIFAAALVCFASGVFAQDEIASFSPVEAVISVADQRMEILRDGMWVARYKISTSKFGLGDSYGSYKTPLGKLRICEKIGGGLSRGAVIKHRHATGEILPVNAPGRDPIVTRILWLDGLEERNKNAKSRGIYIHGTVEESKIGQPVSYGCIRMRSLDVMEAFEQLPIGTLVTIQQEKLPRTRRWTPPAPIIIAAKTPPNSKPPEKAPVAVPEKPTIAAVAESPKQTAAVAKAPEKTKPQREMASRTPTPPSAAESEPMPRVTFAAAPPQQTTSTTDADLGAADALKGSMLFADLPVTGAGKPRTASAKNTSSSAPPAPAEEVAVVHQPALGSAPAEAVTEPAPMPRVTFRIGPSSASAPAGAKVAQRLP